MIVVGVLLGLIVGQAIQLWLFPRAPNLFKAWKKR